MDFNFFVDADTHLRDWFLQNATREVLDRDTKIISEGAKSNGIFILESGLLKIDTSTNLGTNAVLSELTDGSLVGEMSWIESRPAVARVLALNGSVILHISLDILNKLKDSDKYSASLYKLISYKLSLQIQDQNSWVHKLALSDNEPLRKVLVLFAELLEEDVDWLRSISKLARIPKNGILIRQGEAVTSFYLILAGVARIQLIQNNQFFVVGSSARGELLGEMSLVNPSIAGASAQVDTLEGLEVLSIDIDKFNNFIKNDISREARFWRAIARMLSQRSRDQLLDRGLAFISSQADGEEEENELDLSQLSGMTTAGIRFDWLCRQFFNQ